MTDISDTTPATDSLSSDWEAKSAAHNRLHEELLPSNKATLFDALVAAGITHVVVSFDGYGDSGQIENIEVKAGDATVAMPETEIEIARPEWGKPKPERSTIRIADVIEHLVYDFLADTHGDWADNDGAYGDFTFNVAARTITLDYNERFSDSVYSQHVF